MGIGLVPECLVEDELARGEVVTPLPARQGVYEASAGYYLCFPENKSSMDALVLFKAWLAEAASSAAPAAAASRKRVSGTAAR